VIADQDTRDRLLGELDRTFFVEAGAGTGKTKTIVDRIVRLVEAGKLAMEHLAAITFTEAAAAELRDRVREGLERAAAGDRPDQARERCLRAIAEIDLAAIQTIHSFAGGLLRSYPLEAGLPPGFATLDEIERDVAFEDRFRSWFWGAALEHPARETIRRALLLGLTQEHLHDLAKALAEQYDLLTSSTTWPAPPPGDALGTAREVGARLEDLAGWITYALKGPDDPLAQHVARLQPGAERLRRAATEDQALAALHELGPLKIGKGNQRGWGRLPDGRNACTAIKDALEEAQAAVEQLLASHRGVVLAAVLELLRDFTLTSVAQRKLDGVATFQDLLAWARDLLRDHPDVRRRAQRRYQRIFVDEFQDTDPLQAEIVFYLAADPDAPLPADWRDIRPVDGKLFVVGDPKQSIYRFRRADIAVYDALLRRLRHCQERLVQNFRSVRPVIDWVNHHFEHHMQEREGLQPPYVMLEARWERFEGELSCGVYRLGMASTAKAADLAKTEAEALARLARAAREDGWLVSDRDDHGNRVLRPADYRDICVLIPTRTHLRSLERAIEAASVPYRLESGALLLATQEVRDLLAGLRAIEDPSDQVALVAALRSPAYGCSDADLLRWVDGGGRLSHERPGEGPDGPVKTALADLAGFHARRHSLSPPALIETYIRERLLIGAAFGEPRPREAWRRLRYLVARARSFTATGRHSLRAFLDWIAGLERAAARDVESAEAEPDEDAVRIQTIHGAKGLEFPIVLLARLGGSLGGGNSSVAVIADRESGELHCRIGQSWKTLAYDQAAAREKEMEEQEHIRLLYVAGTRARDHLVLSLYRGEKSEKSPAALIERRLAELPAGCHDLDPLLGQRPLEAIARRPSAPSVSAAGEVDDLVAEQDWLAERRALIAAQTAPPTLLLTTPGDLWSPTESEDGDHVLPSSGRHLATEVRRQLARSDEAEPEPTGGIEALAAELAASIRASEAYRRADANPTCRRAVLLLATVDGSLIDLTVDLVYETPGGTVLVLYVLEGDDRAGFTEMQRAAIARGFEQVTGLTVAGIDVIRVSDAASAV
jgi:ATP-dependent helicase/nuclease subunit A